MGQYGIGVCINRQMSCIWEGLLLYTQQPGGQRQEELCHGIEEVIYDEIGVVINFVKCNSLSAEWLVRRILESPPMTFTEQT